MGVYITCLIFDGFICALLFAQATQKQQGFNSLFHAVLCQLHKVPEDYTAEHFWRQIVINLCSQSKELTKMQYIKDNYSLFCQEVAQENGIIPLIDLSAAAVQLVLNIPI